MVTNKHVFLNIIIWPRFHGYFYLRLTAKLAAKFSWWGLAVSVMIKRLCDVIKRLLCVDYLKHKRKMQATFYISTILASR